MAQLSKKKQAEVEEHAGDGEFPVLQPGAYHVRLSNVDSDREGPAGPYWSWEFDVVEPGHSGKLWNNTSLSPKAAFKMKETFDAFGVGLDADTDDLCGQCCKAIVSVRTIPTGNRAGQQANQIDRLVPADDDFAPAEKEAKPDIFAD